LAVGALLFFFEPVWSFLLIALAFGELILLYFFWFFALLYSRVLKLDFSFRGWIVAVAISLLIITGLLLFLFVIASQIQWFDYQMRTSYAQLDLVLINIPTPIPSILWDTALSFAFGFIFTIFSSMIGARSDISNLNNTKQEVEDGYYPKQPNKLPEEMAIRTRNSFRSLLWTFSIWYILLLYNFIATFQIYQYAPLVIALAIPAILSSGFVFLKQLLKLLQELLGKSSQVE
ncbi:MAG: hypothetical protein ACFFBD_15150, partial [Candidatus Hodarchaeota archaeon]